MFYAQNRGVIFPLKAWRVHTQSAERQSSKVKSFMGALSGTQRGSPIYSAYSLKRNKKNYDGRMIQIQQDLSPKSQKM